jgi:hypothetical protein
MGLKLRYGVFACDDPQGVFGAYAGFYAELGYPLEIVDVAPPPYFTPRDFFPRQLHHADNGWVVLEVGFEREIQRKAQLHVSKVLGCAGFFIFVDDGDYWGYELFRDGMVLDQFVQSPESWDCESWFPGRDCTGNPGLVAAQFPWVTTADVAAYLAKEPRLPDSPEAWDEFEQEYERLNTPARPGDEFTRFEECAVLDFLRLLGVGVGFRHFEVEQHGVVRQAQYITPLAPVYLSFRIANHL